MVMESVKKNWREPRNLLKEDKMKIIAGITITIGILMLIEGLFVSIWPKTIKKKIKNTQIFH